MLETNCNQIRFKTREIEKKFEIAKKSKLRVIKNKIEIDKKLFKSKVGFR